MDPPDPGIEPGAATGADAGPPALCDDDRLGDGCGPREGPGCCGTPPDDEGMACCFAKALMAQAASCAHAERHHAAEQHRLTCAAPAHRTSCLALRAAMAQRARFALKLPAPGRPMLHQQALRLQCGGLAALATVLGAPSREPPRLLETVLQRTGSLDDLAWDQWLAQLLQWQARRRRTGPPA